MHFLLAGLSITYIIHSFTRMQGAFAGIEMLRAVARLLIGRICAITSVSVSAAERARVAEVCQRHDVGHSRVHFYCVMS